MLCWNHIVRSMTWLSRWADPLKGYHGYITYGCIACYSVWLSSTHPHAFFPSPLPSLSPDSISPGYLCPSHCLGTALGLPAIWQALDLPQGTGDQNRAWRPDTWSSLSSFLFAEQSPQSSSLGRKGTSWGGNQRRFVCKAALLMGCEMNYRDKQTLAVPLWAPARLCQGAELPRRQPKQVVLPWSHVFRGPAKERAWDHFVESMRALREVTEEFEEEEQTITFPELSAFWLLAGSQRMVSLALEIFRPEKLCRQLKLIDQQHLLLP